MYEEIQQKIKKRLVHNGQSSEKVSLIAVSKTRSVYEIMTMFNKGALHFGENYVQEALEKKKQLPETVARHIQWHLIGSLQSNKVKQVAREFDWVQSVASEKLIRLLHQHRCEHLAALNICIQVNIDNAVTKSGVAPQVEPILALIQSAQQLSHIVIRGLMIIPDAGTPDQLCVKFKSAKQLFNQVQQGVQQVFPEMAQNFDTLSMGMSDDYLLAIDAGSTMVRIGTALFGPRRS